MRPAVSITSTNRGTRWSARRARALARQAEERWPSCRAFVEALTTASVGEPGASATGGSPPVADAPGSPPARISLPRGQRRWLVGAAGMLALACLPLLLLIFGG